MPRPRRSTLKTLKPAKPIKQATCRDATTAPSQVVTPKPRAAPRKHQAFVPTPVPTPPPTRTPLPLRTFHGYSIAHLPPHCAEPYDASRHIVMQGLCHARPPLCEHTCLRVTCTHCRQIACAGTVFYEGTLPQPYVVWCASCLTAT